MHHCAYYIDVKYIIWSCDFGQNDVSGLDTIELRKGTFMCRGVGGCILNCRGSGLKNLKPDFRC